MTIRGRTHFYLLLFVPALAPATAEDSFDRLMREGHDAFLSYDIDRAAASYRQACTANLMAPRLAECSHYMAGIEQARGHFAQAEALYLRALAQWDEAGRGYLPSRATTLENLGELYRQNKRPGDAEMRFLEAIGLARTPEALSRLGGLYGESDRPERGRPLLDEAIEKMSDLTPQPTAQLAYAHNALGMIDLTAGRLAGGETHLREAVGLASTALGEDHPETAAYQTNLALALILEGRFDRAGSLLRRARYVVETRLGSSDAKFGVVFGELSAAAAGENKLGLAEDYAQREISVMNQQAAPDPAALALAEVSLAGLYLRQRRIAEAESILPAAVETERRVLTNQRTLADGILRLAELRAAERKWGESEGLYREAIALYQSGLGADDPRMAPVLRAYADVLRHTGHRA